MSRLNDLCDRFWFAWDMNSDGLVTITDVSSWFAQVFFLPALSTAWVISGIPPLATFLEMRCETGAGWGGAIFSVIAWAWAIERLAKYLKEQF
jgi:hypothetical protein